MNGWIVLWWGFPDIYFLNRKFEAWRIEEKKIQKMRKGMETEDRWFNKRKKVQDVSKN